MGRVKRRGNVQSEKITQDKELRSLKQEGKRKASRRRRTRTGGE